MTAPVQLTAEVVRKALRQVKDPELDMNIIDLGLVYDVEIADGEVEVRMTLTSPGWPAGPTHTTDASKGIRARDGVPDATIAVGGQPSGTPEQREPKVRRLIGLDA